MIIIFIFCIVAGQTTPVVNLTDGSISSLGSWDAENTTEPTVFNVTTILSSSYLSDGTAVRNESVVADNSTNTFPHYLEICPSRVHCDKLGVDCIDCEFNSTCNYGANVSTACRVKPHIVCLVCTNYMMVAVIL